MFTHGLIISTHKWKNTVGYKVNCNISTFLQYKLTLI